MNGRLSLCLLVFHHESPVILDATIHCHTLHPVPSFVSHDRKDGGSDWSVWEVERTTSGVYSHSDLWDSLPFHFLPTLAVDG